MALETEAGAAADTVIRVPSNLMEVLRQSYSTREKMLDWVLAFFVVAALMLAFGGRLRGVLWPDDADPKDETNAGRIEPMRPSQDICTAFPTATVNDAYTYNLPPARNISYRPGPSSSPIPANPSHSPAFDPPEA